MKSKNAPKTKATLLILSILFILAVVFPTRTSSAAVTGKPVFFKKITSYVGTKPKYYDIVNGKYRAYGRIYQEHLYKIGSTSDKRAMSVYGLSTSNKKVVTLSRVKKDGKYYIKLVSRNAGKATIKFKVRINNKVYSYRVPVTVKKYVNPIRTLKIGTNNLTKKYNSRMYYIANKTLRGRLSIIPISGWYVKKVVEVNSNGELIRYLHKSNKTIVFPKTHAVNIIIARKDNAATYGLWLLL